MSIGGTSGKLIAPAGDRERPPVAIENGADAVYFGAESGLNARARARNFPDEELPELMALLHRQGVKGYITLNTLVFTNELDDFEHKARLAIDAGVDAVLVQDLGAARVLAALCPDWPIHASTQMTLTTPSGLRPLPRWGFAGSYCPGSCPLPRLPRSTAGPVSSWRPSFTGCWCVAYSGQCLTSESLGGRTPTAANVPRPAACPTG